MIHVIIGTKAQLIKMAPILKIFNERAIDYNYITTGQHRDTIDEILANFNIKQPDYSLYEGKDITSVVQMFFWGLRNIFHTLKHRKTIFRNDRNGIVLVHGDTFSTLLGAVMGKIAGLKVAHVESGLRSFNLLHPFPEEITRILTFRLSDFMFCPGDWAVANLEKYSGEKINTGYNTLLDALQIALPVISHLDDVAIPDKPYGVVTLHRFENIRSHSALLRVIELVEQIAGKRHLVFILHKPTEIKLRKFGFYTRLENNPNIELRERYDYFRFIRLIIDADLVVSDGGSNQEECHYLGKPVILLRMATERHEGLGKNCVLSCYDSSIVSDFTDNLARYSYERLQPTDSPSAIIVEHCVQFA